MLHALTKYLCPGSCFGKKIFRTASELSSFVKASVKTLSKAPLAICLFSCNLLSFNKSFTCHPENYTTQNLLPHSITRYCSNYEYPLYNSVVWVHVSLQMNTRRDSNNKHRLKFNNTSGKITSEIWRVTLNLKSDNHCFCVAGVWAGWVPCARDWALIKPSVIHVWRTLTTL